MKITIDGGAKLQAARADAKRALNGHFKAVHLRFVTDLPAQQTIYRYKAEEAARYTAQSVTDRSTAGLRFLTDEMGLTGMTAWQVAQVWLNMDAITKTAAADLEYIRTDAGLRLAQATTTEDVEACIRATQQAITIQFGQMEGTL